MGISPRIIEDSLRTIASYEGYAETYSELVPHIPSPEDQAGLRRLAAAAGPGGQLLEIGSGPGWEADFLESLDMQVRRTDATQAFLDLQRARGKQGDLLNVISDPLEGPYDGIFALCVLIHVAREATQNVLAKVFDALRRGGSFLVSVRQGAGETRGDYLMTYWSRNGFASRLEQAGFEIEWEQSHVDCDAHRWFTYLARKPS